MTSATTPAHHLQYANQPYRQSCGMPIGVNEYGTNADGSQSDEYCQYCYQQGEFADEMTVEQMIDACVPAMVHVHPELPESEARAQLQTLLPTLKRWVGN